MTLALSSLGSATVTILSDAAIYDADGVVTALRSKIHCSPSIPLVVAPIGFAEGGDQVANAIIGLSGCGSFDTTILLAARVIASLAMLEIPEQGHFAIMIAGISESRGPCHFVAFTRSPEPDVFPSFELCDPGTTEAGNGVQLDASDLEAVGMTEAAMRSASGSLIRTFALPLAEAMRAKKSTNFMAPSEAVKHIVGGWLELTTITNAGVKIDRITTWPDVIGQKIVPSAAVARAAAAA